MKTVLAPLALLALLNGPKAITSWLDKQQQIYPFSKDDLIIVFGIICIVCVYLLPNS